MIEDFALALTHALLLIAAWRLFRRDDLDADDASPRARGWGRRRDA